MKDIKLKTIPGYERYAITPDGKVFNKSRKRFLKGGHTKSGYGRYCLYTKEGQTTVETQRLVALTYLPLPPGDKKYEVCHKNNTPGDDRVENLYWGTHQENMEQCARDNRNTGTKLLNKYKYEPRKYGLTKDGELIGIYRSYRELSEATGRSQSCLYNIMSGKKESSDGYNIIPAEKTVYACGGSKGESLCYWYN